MTLAFLSCWLLTAAPCAADPTPDPVALVKQLGSDDFTERENAEKQLKALGLKAELALNAGVKSDVPEVRTRAAQLLLVIRKEALESLAKTFDPARNDEPDHSVWKRYKAAAGSDESARRLFAAILRDPDRLRLIGLVEADPDKAGELYEREVTQMAQKILERNARVNDRLTRGSDVGSVLLEDSAPSSTDVAFGFYLGTFPASGKAFDDPNWERVALPGPTEESYGLFYRQFPSVDPAEHSTGAAHRRLFAAWLAQRQNPGSICLGLEQARLERVKEALPVARQVAANVKQPDRVRASTIAVLGMFGDAKDEPLVASLLDATVVLYQCRYGPDQKETTTQARDVALATLLVMRGKNPRDFGFPGLEHHRIEPLKEVPRFPHYHGFYDDTSRLATHKEAKGWLKAKK